MARLGYITVSIALCCSACEAPLPPASSDRGEVAVGVSLLTASERRVRAGQIRDAAAARGMTQGYLLAGIADAETNMSHCWSELTWACQGPVSPDCNDGPVVAGAGDGPCEDRQGGLGMFQFDAGNYDDTLKREGDRILTIDGNVAAAVDFVVAMLIRSTDIDGVEDEAEAIAWSNDVRPDNERWDPWISTVTRYYNGCAPDASCWTSRYALYEGRTRGVFDELGAKFWNVMSSPAAENMAADDAATIDCDADADGRCSPRAREHDAGSETATLGDDSVGCSASTSKRPTSHLTLLLVAAALLLAGTRHRAGSTRPCVTDRSASCRPSRLGSCR